MLFARGRRRFVMLHDAGMPHLPRDPHFDREVVGSEKQGVDAVDGGHRFRVLDRFFCLQHDDQ